MRDRIGALPAKWRLPLGFLLTDELFAIIGRSQAHKFLPWYAFGAGFSFYMVWNVATFVGLVAGTEIPHLDAYGLEFAVAAMFIAIVTPLMRAFPVCGAVVAALVTAVLTTLYAVQGGLVIASCVGMATGYVLETLKLKRQQRSASGAQSALLGKNEHDGEAV
jgi:predicted branched-subunit amino acid permease